MILRIGRVLCMFKLPIEICQKKLTKDEDLHTYGLVMAMLTAFLNSEMSWPEP